MEKDFTERQPREKSSSGMYFNSARMRQKILSGFQNNQDALKKKQNFPKFLLESYPSFQDSSPHCFPLSHV